MNWDRESFMKGVLTGLRLGRGPAGRTPVPPSGTDLCTEDGLDLWDENGTQLQTE